MSGRRSGDLAGAGQRAQHGAQREDHRKRIQQYQNKQKSGKEKIKTREM